MKNFEKQKIIKILPFLDTYMHFIHFRYFIKQKDDFEIVLYVQKYKKF